MALRVLRGAAFVVVVQATHLGNRRDAAAIGGRRDGPRDTRVLVERQLRSGPQVVLHVAVQDAAQPARPADDEVIEALAAPAFT